jgi:SulP family sulfate permease
MAVACGIDARNGIYGAVIAGFLTSAFGGSKLQISGPTLMLLVVASRIVSRDGVRGLSATTMLAGLLLLVLAATGLGSAVRFVPRSVGAGFSTALAVLILGGLLPGLLGNRMDSSTNVNWAGAAMIMTAAATLVSIWVCSKISTHIPASLIAMAVGAFLVKFWHLPVPTIGTNHGSAGLWVSFHSPVVQSLSPDPAGGIFAQAFAISVLVALEWLQAGNCATSLTGERLKPNVELLIGGAANIASSLVGGLPVCGSCAYTSVNAVAGAQTPVAGILQAMFQLAIFFVAAPFVQFMPLPVMASILISGVLTMQHWRRIPALLKLSRKQILVWLATVVLTIATDLPMAIAGGMLIAMWFSAPKQRTSGRV